MRSSPKRSGRERSGPALDRLLRAVGRLLEKHAAFFLPRRRYFLAGTLAVCLAASLGATHGSMELTGDQLARLGLAVNMAWTLAMGALVWFMQLGFAFLGAGLLRSKNQVNYWAKSYIDFSIGVVVFALVGFALMFGGSGASFPAGTDNQGNITQIRIPGLDDGNSFIGFSGFGLAGQAYSPLTLTYFFFEAVFAATAVTIVAGMVAERMKFEAYLIYTVLVNILIYPVYGHWIWGGGWLATLPLGVGARDFAGDGPVHVLGGFTGLAGALLLGPRMGKFRGDGTPNAFPAHNVPYVVAGTFILFFGWFGFNPGSTLGTIDLRTAVIAVNTYLAGGTAAAVMTYIAYFDKRNFRGADVSAICNAALGGLVAITAPVAYVAPWAAIVIGMVAGPLAVYANLYVERKMRIDDPVGAFGVHGVCGLFGLLSVGLFADGTYGGVKGVLLFGADAAGQLAAQLIDMATAATFAFCMGVVIFAAIRHFVGLRVPAEVELRGLDLHEHGYPAYPESVIRTFPETVIKTPEEKKPKGRR